MNEYLQKALNHLRSGSGINIRGVEYDPVSNRIAAFRRSFPLDEWRLVSEILRIDDEVIVVRAAVEHLVEGVWHTIGDGYAEERRTASAVNKTSALENCQTSAWGRALASIGLSGREVASLEEMEAAERQETQAGPSAEFQTLDKCADREAFLVAWKGLTDEQRARVSQTEMAKLKAKFAKEAA